VRIRVTSGAAIVTLDAATQYLPEEEALLARTA
jgi:hypothetical protein